MMNTTVLPKMLRLTDPGLREPCGRAGRQGAPLRRSRAWRAGGEGGADRFRPAEGAAQVRRRLPPVARRASSWQRESASW